MSIATVDAQPLLESLQGGSLSPYEESRVSGSLPTPAPSPIPTEHVSLPQGSLSADTLGKGDETDT